MNRIFTQIIGWYGVLAILAAYFLVSFSFISSSGMEFQILNLTGALALIIETLFKKDYQPAVLNIIWASIALISIFRLMHMTI